MARKSNKRERLLTAADTLFLQKGIDSTTLADIAGLSEVPLGNVYYYFKIKAEIICEVINIRFRLLKEMLIKIDNENTTPTLQLQSFINHFLNISKEELQNFGFMFTLLWIELGKEDNNNLLKEFLPLSEHLIDWCNKKFISLGKGEQSMEYAIGLITSLQGACAMRHNPAATEIMPLQTKFIEHAIGLSG